MIFAERDRRLRSDAPLQPVSVCLEGAQLRKVCRRTGSTWKPACALPSERPEGRCGPRTPRRRLPQASKSDDAQAGRVSRRPARPAGGRRAASPFGPSAAAASVAGQQVLPVTGSSGMVTLGLLSRDLGGETDG